MSPQIAEWFAAAGLLILEGYGLTETTGASFVNRPGAIRIGRRKCDYVFLCGEANKLMTLHAAWITSTDAARSRSQGDRPDQVLRAKVLHDVIDRALQVHGSLGFSADLLLEPMYRAARAARFYDGPDEVHRDSVARLILRGYDAPAGSVPTEHVPTR